MTGQVEGVEDAFANGGQVGAGLGEGAVEPALGGFGVLSIAEQAGAASLFCFEAGGELGFAAGARPLRRFCLLRLGWRVGKRGALGGCRAGIAGRPSDRDRRGGRDSRRRVPWRRRRGWGRAGGRGHRRLRP